MFDVVSLTQEDKSFRSPPGDRPPPGGVTAGDLIVAVNDRVVTRVDDLHRLLTDFHQRPTLTLTLARGTLKLETEVRCGT